MITDKKILLIAPISKSSLADGYTNAALGMLEVLSSMKEKKFIKNIEAINLAEIQTANVPLTTFDIIILIMNPFFIQNVLQQTQLQNILKKGKKVFLQIVWETQPLPRSWSWIWKSDNFSGFIAPSFFIKKQLETVTNKQVAYIPHFVDIFKFSRIDYDKKIKEKFFTVLSIGQWTKRKGQEDAIISFARSSLSASNDCRLIVKYNSIKEESVNIDEQIKNLIRANNFKLNSAIFTSNESFSNEDLVELYKMTSVLLYPSRGEGFGLIPLEYMSIGIPVIYTGWSATAEVAKAPGNIPIKYILDEAVGMAQFGYEIGLKYALPIISDLMSALELKYALWCKSKEAYYQETINNYKLVDERYGIQAVTNNFIEMFKVVDNENN